MKEKQAEFKENCYVVMKKYLYFIGVLHMYADLQQETLTRNCLPFFFFLFFKESMLEEDLDMLCLVTV